MKQQSLPISAEERARLDRGLSASIHAKEEDKKLQEKERGDIQVAREEEERRRKETVVPPKEESAWEKETKDLEAEGMEGLGRSAEEVALREKRTDFRPLG